VVVLNKTEALETLGLPSNFTADELKKTYKTLARKYHPDVAGMDSAKKFIEVKKAFDLLSISGSVGGKNILSHQSIFTVVKN
jgi:molecular chaperone DnaJ